MYMLNYVTKIKTDILTSSASFFMQAVEFSCMLGPLELEICTGMKKTTLLTFLLGEV